MPALLRGLMLSAIVLASIGVPLVTGQMLWVVFKVAGVTFGSFLGVFLLGLLTTRRVADGANVAAMIVMALMNLTLLVLSEIKVLTFGWSWLVVLGTIGTMSPGPYLLRGRPPGLPPTGPTPGPRPRIHPSTTRA